MVAKETREEFYREEFMVLEIRFFQGKTSFGSFFRRERE